MLRRAKGYVSARVADLVVVLRKRKCAREGHLVKVAWRVGYRMAGGAPAFAKFYRLTQAQRICQRCGLTFGDYADVQRTRVEHGSDTFRRLKATFMQKHQTIGNVLWTTHYILDELPTVNPTGSFTK